MRISLNEIKKYVSIPESVSTEDLIKLIGSRLVEVEEAIDLAPKYKNAYIVKVAECEPIEGTHLHLCQIDKGEHSSEEGDLRGGAPRGAQRSEHAGEENAGQDPRYVQVVCGAPNVRKGMLAVWLAPGAIVPQTYGNENFKLGVRKLQGYESNGMLAGLDELDLGDDHSGIVEIDPSMDFPGTTRNVQPGDSFADVFELNDIILDIENKSLTHRPDTFGLIGFAREVAGILGINFAEGLVSSKIADMSISGSIFLRENTIGRAPATAGGPTGARDDITQAGDGKISIKIEDAKLCPRYSCAVIEMKDATEKEKYLTPGVVFLAKAGMRTIDKIVDITNILMLQTGQPLHAFDYDKFIKVGNTKSPKVTVRLAKENEELQLLDGKTIKCTTDDILIASNDVPVALAGAMGGASTEIDASTTKIFLESATFSLYNLRKTQMYHGIFSEAITRFTKGQPAGQTVPVLNEAIERLGGELIDTADSYPGKQKSEVINLTTHDINSLLGTNYKTSEIVKTLANVGINDTNTAADLSFCVPYWRTDLHIKEDIIEEVGRLNGYDNIPKTLPIRPFIGAKEDEMLKLKKQIRSILSDNLGAHEVLTYTFVNKKLQKLVGEDTKDSYEIINSISPDLQALRQSLTPSLLEKIYLNQKAGYKDFTLYEMNQVTKKSLGLTEDKVPNVEHHLALATTHDYYYAKALLENLAKSLHLNIAVKEFKSGPAYFEPLHSAEIILNGQTIGYLGEIRMGVQSGLKLPLTSAFEINLAFLLDINNHHIAMPRLSKYPSSERDLTLKVPADLAYESLKDAIVNTLDNQDNLIYTITPASIYQKEKSTKNISFKLSFASTKKTLESAEISAIMEKVINSTAAFHASVV